MDGRPRSLRPSIRDLVFGNPEAPGKVVTAFSFILNHRTAFFRVGEPVELTAFVRENASDSDAVLVRKVRGALFHHLSRETRAIVGPPLKHPNRIIDETLRDRSLRAALDQIAQEQQQSPDAVRRRARKNLEEIANRYNPTILASFNSLVGVVLSRMFQGVEVLDADIEKVQELKRHAPLVFVPSHKSHFDYLLMGWMFASRGIMPPLVAAGANLSFWPLGWYLRRSSAFFLRRSFKGDPIYGATFKAYVKKLVREGNSQEFFIEGTRSRTGKLLSPKTGYLSFEVDAVLEGARDELYFVPVAIDYDKLVEARSYTREMAGGEKRPESIKTLLAAPRVLTNDRSGRIYISFGEPISLKEFLAARSRDPHHLTADERRATVAALAQRITWGIGRATTLTPAALLCAALLAHRHRGLSAREAGARIHLLREWAQKDGMRVSPSLAGAPSDPSALGPVNEVMRRLMEDSLVQAQVVGADTIYTVPEEKRANLCLYKNNLLHHFATRSFAAFALLSAGGDATDELCRERFGFLAWLLKLEFSFQVGLHDVEPLWREALEALVRGGLVVREGEGVKVASAPDAREELAFVRDLTRDLVESYRVFVAALPRLTGPLEKKALLSLVLEEGRAEFLAGTIACAEALSRPVFENALALCVDQGVLVEKEKRYELAEAYRDQGRLGSLLTPIDRLLGSQRPAG